jgi:hypothetical protein
VSQPIEMRLEEMLLDLMGRAAISAWSLAESLSAR